MQGTVDWMSPEHLSAEPIDERGDVYQVGALLYFCLTGRRPFPRATAEEVLRAHRSAPPPIASVLAPGVPTAVDRVIVRALLKRPADRYPSAGAMAEALLAASASVSASAAPATRAFPRPETTRTTVLRSPRPAAPAAPTALTSAPEPRRSTPLAVVAVLVAAVLGGTVWMLAAAGADRAPALAAPSIAPPSSSPSAPPASAAVPSAAPTVAAAVTAAVPPLAGLSVEEAESALAAAGLTLGTVSGSPSSAARDTVLAATPGTGVVPVGLRIDLVVATGENLVPAVSGAGATEAADAMRAAGFAVSLTGDAAGAVTVSNPVAGSLLPLGQTVTLVLAAPPEPAVPTATPTSTPTPTSTATPHPTAPGASR